MDATFTQIKDRYLGALISFLPAWVTPNVISGLRALLIIPIYLAYEQGAYGWIFALFCFALVTDVLDGIQARSRQQVTTLGKLLDPAADKIVFVGLFIMIAPGRLDTSLIVILISLEILLAALAIVIAPIIRLISHVTPALGANIGGKIKMTLEGIGILVLLAGLGNPDRVHVASAIFWLAAGAAMLSIILHLSHRTETPPPTDRQTL